MNPKLIKAGHSEMIEEEVIAGRLYTGRAQGAARTRVPPNPPKTTYLMNPPCHLCVRRTRPMYQKYNTVLRSRSGDRYLTDVVAALCKKNRYVTTIHAINSYARLQPMTSHASPHEHSAHLA